MSVSQKNGASERDPERMRVRVPRELAEAVEKAVADGSYPDRCCQTNANRSPKSTINVNSGGELAPFGQGSGSVLLECFSAV